MRSIAVMSEKGGTGKTTTAINVAVGLSKRGNHVLLIDSDPQGNASLVLLGGVAAARPTLPDVLMNTADAIEAIRPTRAERLEILPADGSLADVNLALANELGRERRLRLALGALEESYDYAILDTGPARSLVNVNVLNTAGEILVPVDPSLFSIAGLGKIQEAVAEVTRHLENHTLHIAGLVLTRTQRNTVSRDVEAELRRLFGALVHTATIPHNVRVEEAHGRGLSVLDFAPRSPGAQAYEKLVEEIIANGRTKGTRAAARKPATTDNADAA